MILFVPLHAHVSLHACTEASASLRTYMQVNARHEQLARKISCKRLNPEVGLYDCHNENPMIEF